MKYIIQETSISTVSTAGTENKLGSPCNAGVEIIDKYDLAGEYTKTELVQKIKDIGPVFEEKEAIRIARWCKKNGMFAILKAVYDVSAEWEALKERRVHPGGSFDSAGRFYSDFDGLSEGVRTPSRAHPYSEMTACRTEIYAMACALAGRQV